MTQQFSAKHWAEKARKQATGTAQECPAGSAQVWAVGTIDQCPDGSAKQWADDARQTAQNIGNPANRDLSNLTDEGLSRLSNLPLFMSFKTGHILNNASYVNGRLFSWLSGAVYTSAYQELIKEMTGGEVLTEPLYAFTYAGETVYLKSETPVMGTPAYDSLGNNLGNIVVDGDGFSINHPSHETSYKRDALKDTTLWVNITAEQKTQTIAGVTITYYLTPTNKKVCLADQADNIAALYLATGAADFYLLDVANTQFKLPRRHTRRLLRAYKEGDLWYNLYSDGWCEQGGYTKDLNIVFPVSMGNNTYSALVQYNPVDGDVSNGAITIKNKTTAGCVVHRYSTGADEFSWLVQGYVDTSLIQDEFEYECYFVGNTVQNQTALDVGALTQTVNNKADVDLSNTVPSKAFKSQSSAWSMPSDQYVDLTLGTTGSTYTAPANGWFYIVKATSAAGTQYFIMENKTKGYTMNLTPTAGNSVRYIFPISKGDVVCTNYTASGATLIFRFIYAQGEI